MRDVIPLNPGVGGQQVVTDKIGTEHIQVVKIDVGATGESKPVDGELPVQGIEAMVYLLAAILDKLPRIDANDRLITNGSEVSAAVSISSGTVTTVTTVGTVSALAATSAPAGMNTLNAMPVHLANAGANYLYDRIAFS